MGLCPGPSFIVSLRLWQETETGQPGSSHTYLLSCGGFLLMSYSVHTEVVHEDTVEVLKDCYRDHPLAIKYCSQLPVSLCKSLSLPLGPCWANQGLHLEKGSICNCWWDNGPGGEVLSSHGWQDTWQGPWLGYKGSSRITSKATGGKDQNIHGIG
jgi:hypothetical protein